MLLRDSFWVCLIVLVELIQIQSRAKRASPLCPFPTMYIPEREQTCYSGWSDLGLHFLWDLTLLSAPHHLAPIPWQGQTPIHPSPASLLLFSSSWNHLPAWNSQWSNFYFWLCYLVIAHHWASLGIGDEWNEGQSIQVARIYWTWLGHKDEHFWPLLSRILLSGGTGK